MIPTCQMGLLPINFSLFSVISRPAYHPDITALVDWAQNTNLFTHKTCIESLVGWMYSNKFKLNAEKTEVLPVASTSCLSLVGRDSADIGGKCIPFRSSVRNLGVLDQTLSMQQDISNALHHT